MSTTDATVEPEVAAPPRRPFYRRWVLDPIVKQLTQGTQPGDIARGIGWGVAIGILPVIGSTTLISLAVGIPLKLNQPILQVFKTLATPLQWALILGFYRVGEWLFQVPPVPLSIPRMIEQFGEAPLPFFKQYGLTALYGVVVWFLLAPVLIGTLYFITKPLIEGMARRLTSKKRHA